MISFTLIKRNQINIIAKAKESKFHLPLFFGGGFFFLDVCPQVHNS